MIVPQKIGPAAVHSQEPSLRLGLSIFFSLHYSQVSHINHHSPHIDEPLDIATFSSIQWLQKGRNSNGRITIAASTIAASF